jgi:dipeptidyl aminopeptidase/acylaminoacyl peptidase
MHNEENPHKPESEGTREDPDRFRERSGSSGVPDQLFAAGHSSAASMALNVVAADNRFRAVAAYAPATNVVARWGDGLATMNQLVPGSAELAARVSPIRHVAEISCPVFLFHADDDTNVAIQDIAVYVDALRAAGKTVTFQRVPTGGHYQSMIDQGIGGGIQFFESQGAKPLPPIMRR